MTDFETMNRVSGVELNGRMVYLKPSAEMIANLARDRKRNLRTFRLTWGLYLAVLAFTWWRLAR